MINGDLTERVAGLTADRRAFVVATVVRARRPTSVRPGDRAVVTSAGEIEGFVGGVCAESSVRLHALRAIETGEPILLRLVPGEPVAGEDVGAGLRESGDDAVGGAIVEHNPCLSGGALEIFLEPYLPPARVVVIGGSPIASAVAGLAAASGYDCLRADTGEQADLTGASAVIVASHGTGEERALSEALGAGVPYVALVASPRRGEAVRAELDVPDELRGQLHTPAGLNIGARTPAEIAVSILAQLIAVAHADPAGARPGVQERDVTATAVDPVCGMHVAVVASTPRLASDGAILYFCCEGCRDRYAAEHAAAR
jgi:xanthine dehydrogenase accessory factor